MVFKGFMFTPFRVDFFILMICLFLRECTLFRLTTRLFLFGQGLFQSTQYFLHEKPRKRSDRGQIGLVFATLLLKGKIKNPSPNMTRSGKGSSSTCTYITLLN